jgi:hypothetical protein
MRIIGFSPSLVGHAPGHYLPFHHAMFNSFKKISSKSRYIGATDDHYLDSWWIQWAPYSLRSAPNFVNLKKIDSLVKLVNQDDFVIVYEGKIFHLILFSYLSVKTKCRVLINFHYSSELTAGLESRYNSFLFRSLIRFITSSTGKRVVLTSESLSLSEHIYSKCKLEFPVFPVFTVLDPIKPSELNQWEKTNFDWIVCRFSNKKYLIELEKLVKSNPNQNFLINGLSQENGIILAKYNNVRVENHFIDNQQYRKLLYSCNSLILVYEIELYKNHSSGRLLDGLLFEKTIFILEGMPVPPYVESVENINIVKLSELSDLKRGGIKNNKKSDSNFNSDWACSYLIDLLPSNVDSKVKLFSSTPIFFTFWLYSAVSRAARSLLSRIRKSHRL